MWDQQIPKTWDLFRGVISVQNHSKLSHKLSRLWKWLWWSFTVPDLPKYVSRLLMEMLCSVDFFFSFSLICMCILANKCWPVAYKKQTHRPHGCLLRNNKHYVHIPKGYLAATLTATPLINYGVGFIHRPAHWGWTWLLQLPGAGFGNHKCLNCCSRSFIANFHLMVSSGMECKNRRTVQSSTLSTLYIWTHLLKHPLKKLRHREV